MIGQGPASHLFETGLFLGVILEAVRLLEFLGGRLPPFLVIRQNAFIVGQRLLAFAGGVMDAGQQIASVRAEYRIGEGS